MKIKTDVGGKGYGKQGKKPQHELPKGETPTSPAKAPHGDRGAPVGQAGGYENTHGSGGSR